MLAASPGSPLTSIHVLSHIDFCTHRFNGQNNYTSIYTMYAQARGGRAWGTTLAVCTLRSLFLSIQTLHQTLPAPLSIGTYTYYMHVYSHLFLFSLTEDSSHVYHLPHSPTSHHHFSIPLSISPSIPLPLHFPLIPSIPIAHSLTHSFAHSLAHSLSSSLLQYSTWNWGIRCSC